MARYNHFAVNNRKQIRFDELKVGDNFFIGKHINGRSKKVKSVKTGDLSYREIASKSEQSLHHSHNFIVYI